MNNKKLFGWWCAATTLLSAWLLFQVQPLMSKAILPWFGGTPAVWSTCMLFFQVLLLGGYAYAHFLRKLPSTKHQAIVHCCMLVFAVVILPIIPRESWKPSGTGDPALHILILLAAHVGLPYFVLSSTGPLVQSWFATKLPGRSPYRLYALSNIGSLAALLTYPFIVEPAMTVPQQGYGWSFLFIGFAILSGYLSVTIARSTADQATGEAAENESEDDEKIGMEQWVAWVSLPCLASILLLAFTNFVCQDVAVVPFLWVAPLSIYLITFIICFDNESWYQRFWFGIAGLISVILLTFLTFRYDVEKMVNSALAKMGVDSELDYSEYTDSIVVQVGLFLFSLFCLCMVCHGELVRSKPKPRYLTAFYLCVSAGGALGGLFVSLVCPAVFPHYWELPLSIIASAVLVISVVYNEIQSWVDAQPKDLPRQRRAASKSMLVVWGCVAITTFVFIVVGQQDLILSDDMVSRRNFYGVLRIKEYVYEGHQTQSHLELYHGRIAHGCEYLMEDRRRIPTSYYTLDSGVGLAVTNQQDKHESVNVGIIGLGVGTMAAYCRAEDEFTFFEINPLVEDIAKEYFHFLSDSPSEPKVIFGDARNSLEREEQSLQFDVLVVDAFSGDAIPAHLVTEEAFGIYKRHIKETGVIAVHISNRYLDLFDVVAKAARSHELDYCLVDKFDLAEDESGFESRTEARSDWMLVTANQEFLSDMAELSEKIKEQEELGEKTIVSIRCGSDLREPKPEVRMWTDQYSNLFQIMR